MLRGLIGLAVLGGLVYAAAYLPLGERTLWQHIQAIAGSSESKKLVDSVRHEAGRALNDEAGGAASRARKRSAKKALPKVDPKDRFTREERAALRRLIRDRLGKEKGATKASKGS